MLTVLSLVWLKTSFFHQRSQNVLHIKEMILLSYLVAVKKSTVSLTIAPLKIIFLFCLPLASLKIFLLAFFFFLLKFQCNAVSCKFLFNYPVWDLWDSWICRLLYFRIKKKKKSTTTSSVIFAVPPLPGSSPGWSRVFEGETARRPIQMLIRDNKEE